AVNWVPVLLRLAAVLASVAAAEVWAAAPPAADGPREKVERFAPHASGVALAEGTGVEEYDARSRGRNAGLRSKLKRVRGSGSFLREVDVVIAYGGCRGGEPAPDPERQLVKAGSLKKGQRYWFAFASEYEYEKHTQGVIGFWPEKDARAKALEA